MMVLQDDLHDPLAAELLADARLGAFVKTIRQQHDQVARLHLDRLRAVAHGVFADSQRQCRAVEPFEAMVLAVEMQQRALPGRVIVDAVAGSVEQAEERGDEAFGAEVLAELAVDLGEDIVKLRFPQPARRSAALPALA